MDLEQERQCYYALLPLPFDMLQILPIFMILMLQFGEQELFSKMLMEMDIPIKVLLYAMEVQLLRVI